MSSYSEGQIHQLANALERANYTPGDVAALGQSQKVLGDFRLVLLGHAEIVVPEVSEHIIDCDADPFVPAGLKVEEHRKGGVLKWNAEGVALRFLRGQGALDDQIESKKLREELEDELALNAKVLDYLLANQRLIPEGWKGKNVLFGGTIYRGSPDSRVRYLCWRGDRWDWDHCGLGPPKSYLKHAYVAVSVRDE